MLILGLFLLFAPVPAQLPAPCASGGDLNNCRGAANAPMGKFRLNGKLSLAGTSELPRLDVKLLNDQGTVLATTLSFANGTFRFDDVSLARYTIEITDARFNIVTYPVWLREPEQTENVIAITLTPTSNPATGPAFTGVVTRLEYDGNVPAAALEAFKKGTDALSQPNKENPAEPHFKKAIELYPDFYEAHYQLGLEQARLRRPADALPNLEKAVALKPNARPALSLLGRLYVENKQFPKAIQTLLRIEKVGTMNADDFFYLGVAALQIDNVVAAQGSLEQSIKLNPGKNPAAYVQLANAYSRSNNPEKALQTLESFLTQFPNDPNRKAVEDGAKKMREGLQKKP
jgi:tetratricopeptide (TPR) repeat protein